LGKKHFKRKRITRKKPMNKEINNLRDSIREFIEAAPNFEDAKELRIEISEDLATVEELILKLENKSKEK